MNLRHKSFVLIRVFLFLMCSVSSAFCIESIDIDEKVGLVTVLGRDINLGLTFQDEQSVSRELAEYFQTGVPVLLIPVYYDCPRICGLTLNGVVDLVKKLPREVGKDYRLLSVSFDSSETPELAKMQAQKFRELAGIEDPEAWKFLVGNDASVEALMESLGFRFTRDSSGEFAHSAAAMVVTPDGRVSQYFSGIEYPAWDVNLALVEASAGKIGSMIDQVLLYCFHFDPLKGRYTWAAWNVARFGSLLFVLIFFATVFYFIRKKA